MRTPQVGHGLAKDGIAMIKIIATVGGLMLVAAGLIGLIMPGLVGMSPSFAHDSVHLPSGGLAFFFGLKI